MEKLDLQIQTTPEATSKQLAKRCQAENSQQIWALTTKLIAGLKLHGSEKANSADVIEKQKNLCEKLAGRDPEHVADALKLHEEKKPWFPHISDLMPRINELERSERNRQEREAKRGAAWHSGKGEDSFVQDPDDVRKANCRAWRNHYRQELIQDGEAAEEADLSPNQKAARDARIAKQKAWQDPENDPPASVRRLKDSMACTAQQAI